jgi:ATP-dependent Lon protease
MSIISQSQSTASSSANSAIGNQASLANSTEGVASTSTEETTTTQPEADKKSEVQISTRAQKLQKLEQEFFPGGYLSLEITPEFVQRLQDYGFISAAQAENLPESLKVGEGSADTSQLGKVMDHAESLMDKLEGQEQHAGLIEAMKSAQTELEKADRGDRDVSRVKADLASKKLSQQLNESSTKALESTDIQIVKNLMLSLDFVGSFAAGSTASANSYSRGLF